MNVSDGRGRGLNVVGLWSLELLGFEAVAIDFGLLCKVFAFSIIEVVEVELGGQLRAESRVAKVRLKHAPSGKSL